VAGCGRISEDDEGSGGAAPSDVSSGAQPNLDGASQTGGSSSEAGGSTSQAGGSGGTGLDIVPEPPQGGWDWWIENELKAGQTEDDDRPERPADYSLGLELGDPGWQVSTTPICTGMIGVDGMELWADAAGVAVLLEAPCGTTAAHDCAVQGSEVWYNQGSGWTWLTGFSNENALSRSSFSLDGLPGGDLLLVSGDGVLALGRDGGFWDTMSPGYPGSLIDDGESRVYGAFTNVVVDAPARPSLDLASFEGVDWEMLGHQVEGLTRLSVIDGTLYAVGKQLSRMTDGGLEALPELPQDTIPLDLTGTGAEDLYAITEVPGVTQVLHLEGTDWIVVAEFDVPFVDSWADGDGAYLLTEDTFGRISESGFEQLAKLDSALTSAKFTALYGVSGTEIFLAVLDPDLSAYACDTTFLFYWDGAELHTF